MNWKTLLGIVGAAAVTGCQTLNVGSEGDAGSTGGATSATCSVGPSCASSGGNSGGGTSSGGNGTIGGSNGGSSGAQCGTPCNANTFTPTCTNGVATTCIWTPDPPCSGHWMSSETCPNGCDAQTQACAQTAGTTGGTVGGGSSGGGSTGGTTGGYQCIDCFPPTTCCPFEMGVNGALCADFSNDPANCGGCGFVCAGSCVASSCVVGTTGGTTGGSSSGGTGGNCVTPCDPQTFVPSCTNGLRTSCQDQFGSACSGNFVYTGACANGCDSSGQVCAMPCGGGGGGATACTTDSECCSAACIQGICACPVSGGCP